MSSLQKDRRAIGSRAARCQPIKTTQKSPPILPPKLESLLLNPLRMRNQDKNQLLNSKRHSAASTNLNITFFNLLIFTQVTNGQPFVRIDTSKLQGQRGR
eukprot:scaffold15667_cov140-Isochrysis_galbana.AAC.2